MRFWWGVRHLRYIVLKGRVDAWYLMCESLGFRHRYITRKADEAYLDKVWRGKV
jgi:hypothetical protein